MGADISSSKEPQTIYSMLALHMRHLRTIPGCQSSLFVIIPENKLGLEAEHVSEAIQREIGHGYIIMEEKENERGFKTDNLLKMAMAKSFREELLKNNVVFHNKFFTLTTPEGKFIDPSIYKHGTIDTVQIETSKRKPMYMIYREAADNMRDVIVEQTHSYTRYVRPSKDDTKDATVIYSGKPICPTGDDLSVMSQTAVTFHKFFFTREKYKPYWRDRK